VSEPPEREFPETFEELYDDAPIGYLTVRPDGAIVRANRTLLLWSERTLEEIKGAFWSQKLLSHAGHLFVETNIKPLVHVQGFANDIAMDLRTASGLLRPVVVSFTRHCDEHQEPLFWRITILSAADRRFYDLQLLEAKHRAEDAADALRELTAELEERVEKRTAELKVAVRELDSFAYAVSHDLRAPLRAITGFSQLLLEDYAARMDQRARHFLEQIGAGCQTMSELIDALLKLSLASQGTPQTRAVDVSELAQKVWNELVASAPDRDIECYIESGLTASADPRLLEIALRNLLGNAWKYTSRTAHPQIRLYSTCEYGVTVFHVSDNGAGFDMKQAEHLFEPFRRLHSKGEFPGIGIGLATVRRIIERHGGVLTATAEPGKGARFSFTLERPTRADKHGKCTGERTQRQDG
jgi:signal transduction histidine kinase